MNTVIYARYSAGPRQTDQSIEGQLRVCTDFCKQRGLTVIDTYCDRHISGRTDERPEFQRLIADAKRKKSIANVLRAIESGAATQTLPARLQELENEQAVILGEISFLKGKRLAFTEDQILFALMKHLEPYPGESEQDYRRRIISDFVSEVYLYDDRLLIYFNISSEDGKLKSADLSNIEGGEFDEGLVSSTNLITGRTPEVTIVVLPYGFVLATQIKDRL